MENQFYALQLDDYALPGFVSGGKYYYGSLTELDEYFNALQENKRARETHEETILAYKEFKDGNLDVRHTVAYNKVNLLEPIKVYSIDSVMIYDPFLWKHENIYGFPYFMKADAIIYDVIWIKHGSSYIRCVKPEFCNLSYCPNPANGVKYELMNNNFWGQPEIIYQKIRPNGEVVTSSRLFMKEKVFESKKDATRDVKALCGINNYAEFCNEIFADG